MSHNLLECNSYTLELIGCVNMATFTYTTTCSFYYILVKVFCNRSLVISTHTMCRLPLIQFTRADLLFNTKGERWENKWNAWSWVASTGIRLVSFFSVPTNSSTQRATWIVLWLMASWLLDSHRVPLPWVREREKRAKN